MMKPSRHLDASERRRGRLIRMAGLILCVGMSPALWSFAAAGDPKPIPPAPVPPPPGKPIPPSPTPPPQPEPIPPAPIR